MIKVVDANFIKSAQSIKDSLPSDLSEVVFVGRSNVGKSSLLNSLANRKSLAKKSSTPGKTQLINFFGITYANQEERYALRFVDLPGFGYAKVSKSIKSEWHKNISSFLEERNSIRLFIQLIDARHFGLDIDMEVNAYLNSIKQPDQKIITVCTKMDKLNQSQLSKLKMQINNSEAFHTDSISFVSNLKNKGIEKLNTTIFESIFS
jgi:GTP-binding protein